MNQSGKTPEQHVKNFRPQSPQLRDGGGGASDVICVSQNKPLGDTWRCSPGDAHLETLTWRRSPGDAHLEKMLQSVFLLGCLLSFISSAPLSSDGDSSSSSDEDLQPPNVFPAVGEASPQAPPIVPEAPPHVVVEVEDTKTNVTLRFAIFIVEEEEGSGRPNDDSSESDDITDDISSDMQPEASSQPMRRELNEGNRSSEEMMGDQPMFSFSDEDVDGSDKTTFDRNQNPNPSDDFDYFIVKTSTESDIGRMSSDGFNNSTEINHQPDRTFLVLVPQEVTGSSSEKTSLVHQDGVGSSRSSITKGSGFGSGLQEEFRSILEVVDLLSVNRRVLEVMGVHHQVLGSTPNSLTGFSSDESLESVSFGEVSSDPKNQTGSDSDDGDQQGTGSRDSTQQGTGPTTSPIHDLRGSDTDSKEVQESSGELIQVGNNAHLDPVNPDQDVAPRIRSMQSGTVSQELSRSVSQVHVGLDSDISEESHESVVGTTPSGRGLSRVDSPETSSSSEEVLVILSSSSSPVLVSSPSPILETGSLSSEDSDLSDSGSKLNPPGLDSDSQSADLHPDSGLSPEFKDNHSFGTNFSSSSKIRKV
ncbi:dentin sialophosphoprotein-like [Cebidichthys violaceus]|uniref:dentin sialophosphoprotein-like n=1 Tax=Cebidichthys violaceus TaxID=271503 RepID=UPI0035CBCFFD